MVTGSKIKISEKVLLVFKMEDFVADYLAVENSYNL
jgi:hypothetical protein